MSRTTALLLVVLVTVVLAGCGGAGQVAAPGTATPTFKIAEYVGDGHNGVPRPIPNFIQSAEMTTQRLGDILPPNHIPAVQEVPQYHINWFRLAPVSGTYRLLVTLQPTNDGDSDLYVMEGDGSGYSNGASTIAYSDRTNQQSDSVRSSGYSPDWVAFDTADSYNRPVAQVAIYGYDKHTSARCNFTAECDRVFDVTVNGAGWSGWLPQGSSQWVKFAGTSGTSYTVGLATIAGDADLYVYGPTSAEFQGSAITPGTGNSQVTFVAPATEDYYVRIYGYSSTPSQYTMGVVHN